MDVIITPEAGIVGTYWFGRAQARVSKPLLGEIRCFAQGDAHEIELLRGDRTGAFPGRGRALLGTICDRADQLGCALVLNVCPEPSWRRSLEEKKQRLRELYTAHGFGVHPSRFYVLNWMVRPAP